MAVNVNGVKVYRPFVSEYNKSITQENELKALKEEIINNPDIPKEKKQELIDQLNRAQAQIDKAQATATKEGWTAEDGDRDMDLFMRCTGRAESIMDQVAIEAAEYQSASTVDEPSPPADASLSDDIDATTTESSKADTLPPLPKGEAFNVASNPNISPAELAANINAGKLVLSGEDLRALAASDPQKFQEIMSELSKLPGGEETAMRLNQDMQDSLQKMNRMFTLLSNITQALHDTQKSLINNIRV